MKFKELMRRDRPLAVAFVTSATAANILGGGEGAAARFDWPQLSPGKKDLGEEAGIAAAVDELGPFVRGNPVGVPPEAIYRHAQGVGVHDAEPGGWRDLPLQ